MKKNKKAQTEEEKIADYQKKLANMPLRLKRSLIIAASTGVAYLALSLLNPSMENKSVIFTFICFPFLWLMQWHFLHEIKKIASPVKALRRLLVPYFIVLVACLVTVCYSIAKNGLQLPQGIIQVCLLTQLCLYILVSIIILYTLWFRMNRIFLSVLLIFGLLAMVGIPVLQVICCLTGLFHIFLLFFSFFDPYYFFYVATVFFCGPMTVFTFFLMDIMQIRISSEIKPLWRSAFPNLTSQSWDGDVLIETEDD